MICKVKYFNDKIGAYSGVEYTYITTMDLKPLDKVIVPVGEVNEEKKAIVTAVNLPDSAISPAWAARVKRIERYDR